MNPYMAVDGQRDPLQFAQLLEQRGVQPQQCRLRRAFLAFARLPRGARVLDVGCGTGVVSRELAGWLGSRGRVLGVDPSRAFVGEARRRAAAAGLGGACRFRVADGRRLPFAEASFDAVIAVTVLLHVPDGDRLLTEMIRVVRPGGRVAVLDQDYGTLVLDLPDRELTRRILDTHAHRYYADPWSGRGLRRRLRACGLRRIRSRAFVVLELEYDAYVRSLLERRAQLVAGWGMISQKEARRWLGSAEAGAARGEFFMSLNYYGTAGVKA